MNLALGSGWLAKTDRRGWARATAERRQSTPVRSWLRQYGRVMGIALMGVSAVVVVLSMLFFVAMWT